MVMVTFAVKITDSKTYEILNINESTILNLVT